MNRDQLIAITQAAALSKLDLDAVAANLSRAFNDRKTGFNTIQRQAVFLGQICVESAYFTTLEENLNYSEIGLISTFPKYFDSVSASVYAHQPEKIANRVYANRMGNGDEYSGDGWKFRGRGLIQLTGKGNYSVCGNYLGVDLVSTPDYLLNPRGAVDSAVWYYVVAHDLNPLADVGDIISITKAINGGVNGLQQRITYYNKAKEVLTDLG